MSRFFGHSLAIDLAATLLVVLLAVSIADIDDHDMLSQAMRSPWKTTVSLNATADISSPSSEPETDREDGCACLLCITVIFDSTGLRICRAPAGRLSTPVFAEIADSPHLTEIFHPPSA